MRSLTLTISLLALSACASVTPDIRRPSDNETQSTISVKNQLDWNREKGACGSDNDTYSGKLNGKQIGALAAPLVGAAVSAGVDFVGQRLQSAGEEKTRTVLAILNEDNVPKVGCLEFIRTGKDGNTPDLMFTVLMKPSEDGLGVAPILVGFDYSKSIDGKDDGTRGLMLTISPSRPTASTASSRTISLGNVEVGSKHEWSDDSSPFFAGYMANPYVTKLAKPKGDQEFDPVETVTWSFTVTEVKNANALLNGLGEGISDANDDISAEILSLIGLGEDDTDTNVNVSPPGIGGGAGTPPAIVTQ